jgi:hypothetical protein
LAVLPDLYVAEDEFDNDGLDNDWYANVSTCEYLPNYDRLSTVRQPM